jgi:hypothetical protein
LACCLVFCSLVLYFPILLFNWKAKKKDRYGAPLSFQ